MRLKHLKTNKLKINHTFINNIHTNNKNTTIITTILTLTQNLNLHIITKNIKTKKQQHLLTNLNFNTLQKYLLNKPTPTKHINKFTTSPP
ncbi:hypothetical protein DF186_16785, partial [Enterococcus hirae]